MAIVAALAMAMTAMPAVAHDDHVTKAMEAQVADFAAAQSNAPDHSNAPGLVCAVYPGDGDGRRHRVPM